MFTICSCESVDFPPVVQKTRPIRNNSVQTEPLIVEDENCQIPERQNVEMQTEAIERKRVHSVDFEPESVLAFLNKVFPLVSTVLERNTRSHAFDRYVLQTDVDSTSTLQLHSLEYQPFISQFQCGDISWNSTGTAFAVAYSNRNHEDWCEHDSAVGIWNLHRKDFDKQKPNTIIETDCCITAVSFHPEFPALLAAGKFNGEIVLWNIVKDDDMLMANTSASLDSHREPITGLHWISNSEAQNKIKLISCSLDGKILIWKYSEKTRLLEPEDGFIILADQLPHSLGIKSTRPDAEVGVTSMSFNYEDPSIFIVGAEGGVIFQCSLNSQVSTPNFLGDIVTFKSPIAMTFQRHQGHVTSVQFSPFLRNIFLSTRSDGGLYIYSLLQPKPVFILQLPAGVQKAQWSPVRPLVIIAVCDDGQVHIFDLANDRTAPVQSLSLTSEKYVGSALNFDTENPQLLATGSGDGAVQVWKLATSLTVAGSSEKELLKELAVATE